jgi:hypothetical protein
MDRLEISRALEICILRLPGFSPEQGESYCRIRRVPAEEAGAQTQAAAITRNEGACGVPGLPGTAFNNGSTTAQNRGGAFRGMSR